MPTIHFMILSILAVMTTTVAAAPGNPRNPVPNPPTSLTTNIHARADLNTKIALPFETPWFNPKIILRDPGHPTTLISEDKSPVIARAPGVTRFPPPYEGTWPEVVARAPVLESSEATVPTTGVLAVNFTVDCGCWNICTLENVISKDLVCDSSCGRSPH